MSRTPTPIQPPTNQKLITKKSSQISSPFDQRNDRKIIQHTFQKRNCTILLTQVLDTGLSTYRQNINPTNFYTDTQTPGGFLHSPYFSQSTHEQSRPTTSRGRQDPVVVRSLSDINNQKQSFYTLPELQSENSNPKSTMNDNPLYKKVKIEQNKVQSRMPTRIESLQPKEGSKGDVNSLTRTYKCHKVWDKDDKLLAPAGGRLTLSFDTFVIFHRQEPLYKCSKSDIQEIRVV